MRGRLSDKMITQQCGFLQYIDPGDIILADRDLMFLMM